MTSRYTNFFKRPKNGGLPCPNVKCDTSNESYLPGQNIFYSDFLFLKFHNTVFPFKVGSQFSALKLVSVQSRFTGTLAYFLLFFYIF